MNTDNIILIGMPGVGKSTIGVILAKILGYEFVDADLVIQKEEGMLLKDIIREKGADGFIRVENRINSQLCVHHSVVATGGSAIYGEEAMAHFKQIGTVVYLKQSFRVLNRRLRNIKNRGVVLKEGQTLRDLFEERRVLYEKYADITIDEYGLNIEETVDAVCAALNKQEQRRQV